MVSLARPSTALAGMPVVTLSDIARMRVQAISFFAACFLALHWVISVSGILSGRTSRACPA